MGRRGDAVLGAVALVLAAAAALATVVWRRSFDHVVVLPAVASLVGVLIVSRRPGNVVGRLLCLAGLSLAAMLATEAYAVSALEGSGRPGAAAVAWVASWSWTPLFLALLVLLPLLYPDGRLPSRRWRPVAVAGLAVVVLTTLVIMMTPGSIALGDRVLPVENPFGLTRAAALLQAMQIPLTVLLWFVPATGVAALVARFRRADPVVRQQLKWLLYAVGLLLGAVFLGNLLDFLEVLLTPLLFALVPIAVGIAVLRHGLYEIDRIISRTVSYALVSALLVAAYLGVVLALQQLVRPITGESQLAVAGATLVVAALFGPVRRRVQVVVDRRFNRARYDAQHTVDEFRARLRDEVDLDQLGMELVGAVRSTVEPGEVSLWLHPREAEAEAEAEAKS